MKRLEAIEPVEREPRPLQPETVTKIRQAIPASNLRNRAFFTLLYETGIRVGEALGLLATEFDLTQDDEKIRVFGKGQWERTVMLTAAPESIRLLRRHLKQSRITSGSVFRGDPRYGGSPLPLEYSVVHYAWQKYCKATGVAAHRREDHWLAPRGLARRADRRGRTLRDRGALLASPVAGVLQALLIAVWTQWRQAHPKEFQQATEAAMEKVEDIVAETPGDPEPLQRLLS